MQLRHIDSAPVQQFPSGALKDAYRATGQRVDPEQCCGPLVRAADRRWIRGSLRPRPHRDSLLAQVPGPIVDLDPSPMLGHEDLTAELKTKVVLDEVLLL